MANNWFPHDSSAHNDQLILMLRMQHGWEGYGLYWAILESMYETADAKLNATALRTLCLRFAVTEEKLMEVIDYCVEISLFMKENDELFSVRLVEEKAKAQERSKTAKESADRRWKKRSRLPKNANALPTQSEGNAPPTHPPIQPSAAKKQNDYTDVQILTMERDFKRITVEQQWCDVAYADKTWDQSRLLRTDNRREFYRKVTLMLTWARLPKHLGRAKLLFHEIAGFMNDRGAMERVLDDKEISERREFARAENGESYVRQELA